MAARPDRFYSLDVMRGLASLAIVFWHWQNFFDVGPRYPAQFIITSQPFFLIFAPLYQAGYLAVDLFFALSGFIFFSLYQERVSRGEVSGKDFFILRFSRLYPLHLATLLFVAAGQLFYLSKSNSYFHYQVNDLYHFFLNLFFVSAWGFENPHSFNAPFWSVSIEALLYILFFLFCRLRIVTIVSVLTSSALGVVLLYVNVNIGHGVVMFYLGGAVCLLYRRVNRVRRPEALLAATVAIWLIPLGLARIPPVASSHWFSSGAAVYMRVIAFPAAIYALAVYETRRGTLGKRLAVLGDISYSTYLWHFPLQLAFATIAVLLGAGFEIFLSPYVLIVFFGILILMAYLSHRWLELPAQRMLRDKWMPARRRVAVDISAPTPARSVP